LSDFPRFNSSRSGT
jgi:two-component system CheB/CheR fusion protein